MREILIIEDNKIITSNLNNILTQCGYSVISVNNVQAALKEIKRSTFKIIITAIRMEQMDGLDFCRELRHFNSMTYLIGLTASSSLFEVVECRSAGFDDYIMSPLDPQVLLKRIQMGVEKMNSWIECYGHNNGTMDLDTETLLPHKEKGDKQKAQEKTHEVLSV